MALLAAISSACLISAPAHAVISGEYGVQFRALPARTIAPLQYHGGPVISASDTFAIYWDPQGAYRPDWMSLIDHYLHNVGAASGQLGDVFSLDGQYTGPGGTRASYNSTFRGAYTDTDPYPAGGGPTGCTEPSGQATCLSDAQIRAELKAFIEANSLPKGINDIYFVLTPPGVAVCTDAGHKGNCSDSNTAEGLFEVEKTNGICGYHSAIEPTSTSPIVYGVQPWVAGDAGLILQPLPLKTEEPEPEVLACQNGAVLDEPNQTGFRSPFNDYETGLADVITNGLSIEQNDIVVDPLLNGWYQTTTKAEQADMCQRAFSTPGEGELPKPPETTHALSIVNQHINGASYYLQWAFSSVGVTSGKGIVCWEGTELSPHFTAPNPVNTGDIVGFDANESAMALDAKYTKFAADEPYVPPVYKWEFGDGTPTVSGPSYASVFHSYQYGGTYAVTLTVTDSGGNIASVTNSIKVIGPPPPSLTSESSIAASGVLGASASPTATSTTTSTTATSAPRIYDFVMSHSLKKVLRYGLAIRYTVNEQIAGGLEVILDSRTAKRLRIHGPTALNLPKGYPRSIVIGGAVLVTTKGGAGTLRVIFPKRIAKRLVHSHSVKLTLRLVVRGAARHGPRTATLLSTVVLN